MEKSASQVIMAAIITGVLTGAYWASQPKGHPTTGIRQSVIETNEPIELSVCGQM